MNFTKYKNTIRWVMIGISFIIISLILWNTYVFFQNFKAEERTKMDIWAEAQSDFINSDTNANLDLPLKILSSNKTTPMLVINKDGSLYSYNNINENKVKDSSYVNKLISKFKSENKPIEITYNNEVLSTIYYGDSDLLNKLKYYPLALLLIIVLFGAVVYFFYRSNKNATENKLWSGMAKETAHQIGTPLSSLIGWTEILKSENINPDYIVEMEKDVDRLKTITERFSKIGSVPTLEPQDIIKETIDAYSYLKVRSSNLVEFEIITPNGEIMVNLNKQLYGWTIENLVKNAIDAMKGRGKLTIAISELEDTIKINVTDTGKGIPKNKFNTIFEPGYTTKKRGWGLGLSLTKRIIEEFHNGKIKVLHSELGKGTTIQIMLKRA
ncbi:two-component sensor histidine kinase [Yeosuana aromativorans]|uniref:histidine kinase n=1 Tax=Yeosuana aromativorans TaxID=288019 RepID=A0A8J3BIA0_9FLAO|nr:HAMP domain-containing sensor histidine kinase [Yeosuana aromativorans]GGK23151.1 two-component sensor histidine kinase [Yeosuana aromativorans]